MVFAFCYRILLIAMSLMPSTRSCPPNHLDALLLPHCRTVSVSQETTPRYVHSRLIAYDRDCPSCRMRANINSWPSKEFIDLPIANVPVVVSLAWPRFACRNAACETKTFSPNLRLAGFESTMTARCMRYIEDQCLRTSVAKLVAETGVPETTVRDIQNRLIDRLEIRFCKNAPRILAIDEIVLRSGKDRSSRRSAHLQKVYRTILSDAETSQVIEVLPDRKNGTIFEALIKLPGGQRVSFVTMDMCMPFRDVVTLALGVPVILDRWHVAAQVNRVVDKLRGEANKSAGQGNVALFKRNLYERREKLREKNPAQLTSLLDVLQDHPILCDAYNAKEEILDVWSSDSKAMARQRFNRWLESLSNRPSGSAFSKLGISLNEWRSEVLNYWDAGRPGEALLSSSRGSRMEKRVKRPVAWKGHTNGSAEARNRELRAINRQGRSHSFKIFRARALFSTFDVKLEFGICSYCERPFKRDARLSAGEPRLSPFLRTGPGVRNRDPLSQMCRECDSRWDGVPAPDSLDFQGDRKGVTLCDVWSVRELRICDGADWMNTIKERVESLRRRRRSRRKKLPMNSDNVQQEMTFKYAGRGG